MKTSSIYTIDHRSSVWMGWLGGYFARSRLGLGDDPPQDLSLNL